jgi:hypothetical protein
MDSCAPFAKAGFTAMENLRDASNFPPNYHLTLAFDKASCNCDIFRNAIRNAKRKK